MYEGYNSARNNTMSSMSPYEKQQKRQRHRQRQRQRRGVFAMEQMEGKKKSSISSSGYGYGSSNYGSSDSNDSSSSSSMYGKTSLPIVNHHHGGEPGGSFGSTSMLSRRNQHLRNTGQHMSSSHQQMMQHQQQMLRQQQQQQQQQQQLQQQRQQQQRQQQQRQQQQQQLQQQQQQQSILQRAMSRGRMTGGQNGGDHTTGRQQFGKTQRHRKGVGGHQRLPQIGDSGGSGGGGGTVKTVTRSRRQLAPGQVSAANAPIEYTNQGGSSSEACGVCSIKGHKPGNPNWINQDNYAIEECVGGDPQTRIYIVLDGHGEFGHLVSSRCHDNLPKYLMSTEYNAKRSNAMMQSDLNNCPIDVKCSGATCVTCVIKDGKAQLGNCGDSRGVLGRRTGTNSYTAVPLTRDHKPDRQDEKRRIQEAGGQVGCRQIVVGHSANGPVMLPMGPARVWYTNRGETMGLAMSRSLGDSIVHTVGVSAEPEITDHEITESDEFLIMGTDGVWDVIDNNQAVEIVQNHIKRTGAAWDAEEAATIIARSARRRWSQLSSMIDDITCLVIKI